MAAAITDMADLEELSRLSPLPSGSPGPAARGQPEPPEEEEEKQKEERIFFKGKNTKLDRKLTQQKWAAEAPAPPWAVPCRDFRANNN